ncbi:hypothetical protein GCM10022251_65580 [Phytohabitans flavus]|uniref:Uncharacterized protein n=1 Tax=Phytohabitans flavus TaxID=1076124 RepID=A0A6F8XIJ9_9ACTN|nr:hypothetical protein [Phytohabitans flavus]BCB73629.1 hypothetical protein Pflav_000390 [Phytohabitans flavus]
MSAAWIDFSDKSRLQVDADRHPLQLSPGIGGAQIELSLTTFRLSPVLVDEAAAMADQRVAPAEERLRVSAALYVSVRNPQQDRRFLCTMESDHLATAVSQPGSIRMRGFVSDHQLRVVEELCAGKRLWLILLLRVLQVEGKPARFAQPYTELAFDIGAGEWADHLEQVDAGTYIELLVPLTGGADYAGTAPCVTRARTAPGPPCGTARRRRAGRTPSLTPTIASRWYSSPLNRCMVPTWMSPSPTGPSSVSSAQVMPALVVK